MTKSRAIERTAAELDSHRETMNIHRDAAIDAHARQDWNSVIAAVKLALPHANVINDKQARSELFGRMNVARAAARKKALGDYAARLPNAAE